VWEKCGDEVQTWFGRGDHIRQDDHVFFHRDFGEQELGDAWVAEDAASHLGLSDHAPLALDFEVESIAMSSL
jgi:hypothetical protein